MKRYLNILLISCITFTSLLSQTTSYKEYSKLENCVDYNQKKRIYKLIDKGISIESRDTSGKTILLHALQVNKTNFATLFIDAGADIHATDNRGNTSLHYAIENCTNTKIVYTLIEKGVDIKQTNAAGYSPFHYSLLFACSDLPFYLLQKGVDYNTTSHLGETSLHLAIESGCDTIINFLLAEGANINVIDSMQSTPLLVALKFEQPELAKRLIQRGANVNAMNQQGESPIFFAVYYNYNNLAKLLLENGALIPEKDGASLLSLAAEVENITAIEYLLSNGAEKPKFSETSDLCINSALVYLVSACMTSDTTKIKNLSLSKNYYTLAKSRYKEELRSIRAKNTGQIFGEILAAGLSEMAGTSYSPYLYESYEEEKKYIKQQIQICKAKIEAIEKYIVRLESNSESVTSDCYTSLDIEKGYLE